MTNTITIGIAVFAYNRAKHLASTLDALKESGVTELYVFQDGPKEGEDIVKWEATHKIIENIDWCKTIVLTQKVNIGLAASIVQGVSTVLKEKDAVMVFEDDCVPNKNCIPFMKESLQFYEKEKKVFSITGYSFPLQLEKKEFDAYFSGRFWCWGWATWKDRWNEFERDYTVLKKIYSDKDKSKNLALWGMDLENMFIADVKNILDTWATYVALHVVNNSYYTVVPYENMVSNIGLDGSGVHCFGGGDKLFDLTKTTSETSGEKFNLPVRIEYEDEIIRKYSSSIYGCRLFADYGLKKQKEKIIIYGTGTFYKQQEKKLQSTYDIVAYVDRLNHRKFYCGIPYIPLRRIGDYSYDKIFITIKNPEEREKMKKILMEDYGVNTEKIAEVETDLVGEKL